MNMIISWYVSPCSVVELTDVSEVRTASIVLMMETVSLKRRSVSTRLHGATSQKTVIFV
jgi:hypothetical protein